MTTADYGRYTAFTGRAGHILLLKTTSLFYNGKRNVTV